MTAERYLSICKYANKIYYSDKNRFECLGGDFEDFKQTFLLYALMFPSYCNAGLYKRIRLDKMVFAEDVPYQIQNMKMFSDILQDENNAEYIENTYLGTEQNFEGEDNYFWLNDLAKIIFKSEDMQDSFLDFVFGSASVGGQRANKLRQTLFRHRFEVLDFLLENSKISYNLFDYYMTVAEAMTKQAPVKKVYSDSYYAKLLRNNYDPKKAHERYLRKKAQKQKAQ